MLAVGSCSFGSINNEAVQRSTSKTIDVAHSIAVNCLDSPRVRFPPFPQNAMARPRRCKIRSIRAWPLALLVLLLTPVPGCRSRQTATPQQPMQSQVQAATPEPAEVQLTSYRGNSNEFAYGPQSNNLQPPREELPPPVRLIDPRMPQSHSEAPSVPSGVVRISPEAEAGVEAMTLEQAVATALRQNPRLRQAAARVGGARAGAEIAYAPFLPQIGTSFRYSAFTEPVLPGGSFVPASLATGVNSFVVAEAGVQWTLYDFGRTQGRYDQAVDRARIEALALDRAKQTVAFEATQTYFRLLAAQANWQVRREAVERANAVLRDAESRFNNGTADRENVLRAQVEVALMQEDLFGARQEIHDAEAMLNVVLGRSAAVPVAIEPVDFEPDFNQSFENCLQTAAMSRREIEMARGSVAEARSGVEAARGELLPRVFIRGAVIRADSPGPLNAWVEGIGLHAEQSIYTGGAHRGAVRRSQAEVAGAVAALQSILDQVTLQVRVSYEAIATDLARVQLGERTVGQARENLRLTGVKYDNGTATPTDIVDAQTALTEAQTIYITAIYSYLSNLAQLQYAMGNNQRWLIEQSRM